jgi:hypothetical protein
MERVPYVRGDQLRDPDDPRFIWRVTEVIGEWVTLAVRTEWGATMRRDARAQDLARWERIW